MIKKSPKADLRSKHTLFIEVGIICSLLFMIAATNIDFEPKVIDISDIIPEPDFTPLILPPILPPDTPPPPIKPSVFNVLPQDSPIEPDPIDFGPTEFGDAIPLPPPPIKLDNKFELLPEIMPEMKGGIAKLYSEIIYPKEAISVGIEGKVIVQFVVNKKGEIENPVILRGIGGGCDEEVMRVIKLMNFTPGIQNGNFVDVKMTQTVIFRLQK
ncbi:MAG: energy transducer TonB [Balneolaceae bacterium]|nr:energy transducer TonB [Balneolaceae bacterium]MBO6546010.1 energy transducer TonB [Balneolaceae bacterium]MBO6647406.1 energy transducer TonB [Balneolaceae bacterium]